MSELDVYFDVPKPKKRYDVNDDDYETIAEDEVWKVQVLKNPKWFAKATEWPKAPEHLRPLLDWFTETTNILPRTTSDKRYQVKAASGFYEEFGSDTKLADKAYRVLRKSRYIVSSLDSLRKTARGLKIVQIDPDSEKVRRKYNEWNE